MFNPFPKSPDEIDAEWLNAALESEGNPAAGRVRTCMTREIGTGGNTGWYALSEITCKPETDLPTSLFTKVATQYGLKFSSQYQNYATEVGFYREVAPHSENKLLRMVYGAADKEIDGGHPCSRGVRPETDSKHSRWHIA